MAGALGWHQKTRGCREESTMRPYCCWGLKTRSRSCIRGRYTRLQWGMSCFLKGLGSIHTRIQSFFSFLRRYRHTLVTSNKRRAYRRSSSKATSPTHQPSKPSAPNCKLSKRHLNRPNPYVRLNPLQPLQLSKRISPPQASSRPWSNAPCLLLSFHSKTSRTMRF